MIVYPDNEEIQLFVVKAQNKIADLSTLIVSRGGRLPDSLNLLLELSDFIECLDDSFNIYSEEQVIKWVHAYNHRANLNEITYLSMTGIEVNVVTSSGGFGLPITTANISDFNQSVNTLISAFQHNSLSGIQPISGYKGFVSNEKYHLSKEMYDFLYLLIHPFIQPVVGLSAILSPISSWPNNYYELGTSITSVNLQGSIVINSGEAINYYRYRRNGNILSSSQTNNPLITNPVANYIYNTPTTANTTFSFEADFLQGGTKSISYAINFRQPMYYGVYRRDQITTTTAKTLTKLVEDKSNKSLVFTVPNGNTALTYNESKAMVVFIPGSWGNPTAMIANTFNFISNWTFTNVTMTLADNTTASGILGVYNTQTEGITTFNMQF